MEKIPFDTLKRGVHVVLDDLSCQLTIKNGEEVLFEKLPFNPIAYQVEFEVPHDGTPFLVGIDTCSAADNSVSVLVTLKSKPGCGQHVRRMVSSVIPYELGVNRVIDEINQSLFSLTYL